MPTMIFVGDLVEANGKTVRENNLAKQHKIPIGTLVELHSGEDDDWEYEGMRMYVCGYSRDCDGTPLYGLGSKLAIERRINYGFGEGCMTVVTS